MVVPNAMPPKNSVSAVSLIFSLPYLPCEHDAAVEHAPVFAGLPIANVVLDFRAATGGTRQAVLINA
jgi:hypothetical protein